MKLVRAEQTQAHKRTKKKRREKDEEREREDERTAGCDYEMENWKREKRKERRKKMTATKESYCKK